MKKTLVCPILIFKHKLFRKKSCDETKDGDGDWRKKITTISIYYIKSTL